MRQFALLLCIASGLFLSGCAATGPRFTGPQMPEPGKANLYVYRTSQLLGALMPYDVFLDDRKIGSVANSSYLKVTVQPGRHDIRLAHPILETSAQPAQVQIEIAPDTSIYLRFKLGAKTIGTLYKGTVPITTLWNTSNSLSEVQEREAVVDLADLNAAQ